MLIRVAAQAVHRWQLHPRPDAAQALTSSRIEVEVEVAGVRILRVPITESTIIDAQSKCDLKKCIDACRED